MKPTDEFDQDIPSTSPPPEALPAQPSSRGLWLSRAGIGLLLTVIAVLGFGSSAGWFVTDSRDLASKSSKNLDAAANEPIPAGTLNQLKPDAARTSGASIASENNLTPASNPPPLAALVPDKSLEIIAECRRVAQHLRQIFPNSLEAQEMQARVEFQLGDVEQARAIWLKILDVEPNYVHALRGVGDVCTLNGELKEAVQYFRRAVLADPEDLTRQVTLGVALLQAAEVEQATEVLRTVVARNPQHVGAQAELGRALSQAGDFQSARTHFEAALKEESRLADPSKVHLGLATVLQRLGDKEQAKHHQQEYQRLRKSVSEQRKGERRDYDDVKAIGLDAARLYVDMARVYLAGRQAESAELLLLRASRMNPTDVECRQALAFLAANQNRLPDAIRWLRELALLKPDDFPVTAEIARLYAQMGDAENAERYLKEYLEAQPKSAAALGALAEFYLVVVPDGPNAVEFSQACADVQPTAESFSRLAAAHQLNESPPEAIAALERAVELAPGNAVYMQRLALLRETQSTASPTKKP